MKSLFTSLAIASLALPALAGPAEVVVAVEREFAADGAKRGWVAAFKTYSAPDGIVFQPDPVNAKASLAKQPDEPADISLKWWPVWAGISQSGDLGFTTGPFTVAGDKGFGHYFTVWAKQPDGAWRWIYDGGPRNAEKSSLGPETTPVELPVATTNSGNADQAWAEVRALEVALAAEAVKDAAAAYLKHLSTDARVMGSPAQPAVGVAAYTAELATRAAQLTLTPIGGRAAAAGDLVYTYGTAEWTKDGQPQAGHTVRIWQKRAHTGWQIVFDELLLKPRKRPS
jgi:ketosteroid isomerase-like protein